VPQLVEKIHRVDSLPTLIACGGMDAAREIVVSREGDGYLTRGFAVLAVECPGQGEAPIHGVHVNAGP